VRDDARADAQWSAFPCDKALEYDPDDSYACHSLAVSYQRLAAQTHDSKLLETAKEYYRRALKIDPNHEASKRALATLE
jgi:Tfp pilus assembly protein PilF